MISLSLSLSLSQWEIALGNPVTSQSPQAPLMTHHIHINFQRVPKDGLAQLHKKEKKEKKEKKKNTLSSSFTQVLHMVLYIF